MEESISLSQRLSIVEVAGEWLKLCLSAGPASVVGSAGLSDLYLYQVEIKTPKIIIHEQNPVQLQLMLKVFL